MYININIIRRADSLPAIFYLRLCNKKNIGFLLHQINNGFSVKIIIATSQSRICISRETLSTNYAVNLTANARTPGLQAVIRLLRNTKEIRDLDLDFTGNLPFLPRAGLQANI